VPGDRINDKQVLRYMTLRRTHTQEAAAAKVGISIRSARRIEGAPVLPSQRPRRWWRSRPDPLAEVWESEIVPLLAANPDLLATTILQHLQDLHPGRFHGVLRTLQRRHGVSIRVIGDPGFRIPGVTLDALPWRVATEVADLLAIDIGLYPLTKEEWDLGKSGLKALQYMALGIPTVLTPFGANLDIVAHDVNGLFADTDDEWIAMLTRLILDPALRERLGRAGRDTVVARYSVDVNWPRYLRAVRDAAGLP